MPRAVSASRRSDPDAQGDGSARSEFAEVNLDEKDRSKAIERRQDQALPPSEDADEGNAHPAKEQEWLNRNRAVSRRLNRQQRQFNQQIAEIQADRQRERSEWQRKFDSLKASRDVPAVDEAKHNSEMSELERQLEAAHEAGNSKEVVRLTRQISQKDAAFLAAKQAALLGTDVSRRAKEADESDEEEEERPQRRAQANRNQNGEGARWSDSQDWWDDPEFAAERGAAIAIDKVLIEEEGSDPDSREHYAKLTKRLKKKFPELDVVAPKAKLKSRDQDDEDESEVEDEEEDREERSVKNARGPKRPPIPAFNDRGQQNNSRQRGNRSVVLTEQDRAEMRKFKMDPDNDDDVMEWAQSIEETDRAYR